MNAGLEGVVVAETVLSRVDGEAGRLVLRGQSLEAVAGRSSFEEGLGLMWGCDPPALGPARARAWALLDRSRCLEDGMDELRRAVGGLPASPPEVIAAAVGVAAASWIRRRAGREALPPAPGLGHAADLLRMIRGDEAPPEVVAGLDTYLVTVVDHGLNASTFTARVVASTGSDDVSAVVAAIGALKGPLHGGAPGPVLDMLDAVVDAAGAPAWIAGALDAGRRIMGMGHRVYRARDPRAAVLEGAVRRLAESPRLALARAVEREAEAQLAARKPDRVIRANVEFYTAVLLEALGLPREAFTPIFAAGRVGGWLAHVAEQRDRGRLIRPRARYVGPEPRLAPRGYDGGA